MNRKFNREATYLPQTAYVVLAGLALLFAGCTTSQTTSETPAIQTGISRSTVNQPTNQTTPEAAAIPPAVSPIQEKAGGEVTSPKGPAAALVKSYLAAAASLDASATKSFLSANCRDDIVTVCQANTRFGWILSGQDTRIVSEVVNAQGDKATVKAEVVFKGGSGPTFMKVEQTFFLVLENGAWKILGMAPMPSQVGPGFRRL